MDLMEKNDPDNQMPILQSLSMEEEEEDLNDEAQDMSNSLREIVQEEIVKPKLQCLMMDPAFSMVTLQSEDSGILWETASSRCSTPWISEISSPAPDLSNSLVPRCPTGTGSETAGRIVFIMDEDNIIRRKKRKRNKEAEKLPMIADEAPREPDRPAMVEVSVPNVTVEKEKEDERKDTKEARKQRLFCLVSEGSEILNIVVPPKLSTVDEEESKGLEDNLSYLEETPVIKAREIPEEPEASEETGNQEQFQATVQAVTLPPLIKPRKQGMSEDYFEKFTLLDHQAPSGVPTVDENQEPEYSSDQELYEGEDNAMDIKPVAEVSEDSASINGLEITSEHVDEVFYGGGQDPDFRTKKGANKEEELPKSSLKKSGSALFGSQESILTPIFLPEGPQKIIDLVLLEEPKAMAFMYSDLYAEAVGSRTKQEDTESVTSEKSFHSQESELEDRGYLEKFVLKDETQVTQMDPLHDDCKVDGIRMWSRDAFGFTQHDKDDAGTLDEVDEITDFFRNSASSSPCEPLQISEVEPEETRRETKVRHVVFQDEGKERTTEEDIDIAEAFLPLDIGMEESLNTADYKSVINEYAAKTCAATPSKTEKTKFSSKAKPPKHVFIPFDVPQTVKPITPRYKPFLELTPLLPVEVPEEDGHKDVNPKEREGSDNISLSTTVKGEKASVDAQDYVQISQQEASESAPIPQQCSSKGREDTESSGFTTAPALLLQIQLDLLYDEVEADK
ncbi:cardiomyopathy-associated protein 5 [Tachysurus vachellii]|uniref:cardiomyopathy-associated protein 5 n=1 Tax=Tachysurus vachellii TaxID=175792 RepID=UPI00296AB4E3|nr:cardiomyopathy-associated protein 5 [Tachysurus vachellii]